MPEEESGPKSLPGKIFHYAVTMPCTLLRNISIPPSSEENWSRFRASLFTVPSILAVCLFLRSKSAFDGQCFRALELGGLSWGLFSQLEWC